MGHLLTRLKIFNFKSIKDIEIDLTSYSPLIGYNNAGKTNILEAIKWVLRRSNLKTSDFNDINQSIVVEATIEGITEEILDNIDATHRSRIEPFLIDNSMVIKRTQLVPNAQASQFSFEVKNPINEVWTSNPTGIDNAIKDLFPEPIHIGAMENAEEDVSRSRTTTTIGKLLAEIIGPIEQQYGDQLRGVLEGLKEVLDADGANRAEELSSFDEQVNRKLDAFFPDINVKVHVPTPEIKEVFTKGTIKVYENQSTIGTDVSSLGHGAQRSIQMALIRHLADLKLENEENSTTTLLLIDEPELYLHPQAIEILRNSLKILSEQGYQIVFTTHSPFMVTQKDIANTILIRKNTVLGTHKRNSLRSAIPQIEQNSSHQITLMFALSNSSNILFSERVILAEGKTENRLLPFLVEQITSRTLGLNRCALVQQGGSSNTKKSMQVLAVMDLPCKALVDLDYAFTQAIEDGFLMANDSDVLACKNEMAAIASDHGVNLNNGWPTKRNSSMTASEAFALLSESSNIQINIDNLKTKLQRHNIWVWTKGAIEQHLNLSNKTEVEWARFVDEVETNGLQVTLGPKFQEVRDCITWLLS